MNLQQIINGKLREAYEKHQEKGRSGKFIPSSFGRCYRYQIWRRKGEEYTDPPDDRGLRIFSVGTIFHEAIEGWIKDVEGVELEVKVEGDDVVGYADVVLPDRVYDIKTQHSKAFWYMNRKGFTMIDDKLEHVLQVSYYAIQLKRPQAGVLYVSKDDLTVEERVFPVSTEIKTLVAKELSILRGYWERKEIPKPEPRAYGGKECKYCPFKTKCGKGDV